VPSGRSGSRITDPDDPPLRIWLVGFGTVGQWLVRALDSQAERLAHRYGIAVAVVGLANARDGFIFDRDGLDLPSVLERASRGESIASQPGVHRWPSTLEGLRATEADLLVEVAASPSSDGEPGFAHMREALERGIPVVTSNKWPVALHGVELAELARDRGAAFRAESTVMSGTPLLSALVDGLAGTTPIALRGLLNATVNFILTRMTEGSSYEEALAKAQRAGLAERDPSADVEGHDAVAKVMILSALVFGRQLRREQVACRGVTDIARAEMDEAASSGARLKHVATLAFAEPDGVGEVTARVEPQRVGRDDPLAGIEGTANALVFRASPVGGRDRRAGRRAAARGTGRLQRAHRGRSAGQRQRALLLDPLKMGWQRARLASTAVDRRCDRAMTRGVT
jgi:homoserine dehydrogenase